MSKQNGLYHNSAQYKPVSVVLKDLTRCYARRRGACDRSWVGGIMIKASRTRYLSEELMNPSIQLLNVELLQAINDWQMGGNANQKKKRGKILKEASSRLPREFCSVNGKCYRQIALDKNYVWQIGTQYELSETLSSWTKSLKVAQEFKGGVPPDEYQGVIFQYEPEDNQVIINLSEVFENAEFAEFLERNKKSIENFDKGIGRYGNSQSEVIIETKFLPLEAVHSWGGYTSPEVKLAKLYFEKSPSNNDLENFRRLMKASGIFCGPYWLSSPEAVERVTQKLKTHGMRLSDSLS